jgi:hypothetical protein
MKRIIRRARIRETSEINKGMKPAWRASVLFVVILAAAMVCSPRALLAQDAATSATSALTWDQMEAFLLTARILKSREIGKGVTGSRVATLSDGQLTHDAHIQIVSIEKQIFQPVRGPTELNFKDHYRYNIAAYRLARVLGLANVPVSVERRVDRDQAAITWWIDDVLMDELERLDREKKKTIPSSWRSARTAGYIHIKRVFDELIGNTDRNVGNQLWTSDGTLWLIDHTRAFRLHRKLKQPHILQRCDRHLFKALQGLTIESVTTAVDRTLTKDEIKALITRRDLIVKQFVDRMKLRGEAATLFRLTQ